MNWKSFVETAHAKEYVLPQGWDSKDQIAEQLNCAADSVRRLLAPALKAGTVESACFPVWDDITKKVIRVTAYRKTPPKPPSPAKK